MNKELSSLSEEIISSLVLQGDLSKLTPNQKVQYYNSLCERIGLDPTTQPFKLLKLNGKEVLYADKGCAQQLCKIYNISTEVTKKEKIEDVYCVTVRAIMKDRHTDEDGAVTISGLKGDILANAMMKAVTKAKRRAVLALCGLGMLDETEIETIKYAETIDMISSKPVLDMPRETPKQTEIVKPGEDLHKKVEPVVRPSEVIQEIPRISQSVWDDLVKMALGNGWTEVDIGANVRSLGYKANKKYTALNADDYETVEAFFSCRKTDYETMRSENITK
jgi:hypothetical protein